MAPFRRCCSKARIGGLTLDWAAAGADHLREETPATPRSIRRSFAPAAALTFATLLAFARAGGAQAILPPGFSDVLITGGLRYSAAMAPLPDLRILVTEKYDARLRLVANGTLVVAPVAVIDSVRQSSESGLLGVAVDPGWPARPYVYLHYNYLGSRSIRIARYAAVGDLAYTGTGAFTLDLTSRFLVLADLPDQYDHHNGGGMRFGPDGMLYVSLGDDGDGCAAVRKDKLQGKILRLDVSQLPGGAGGPPPRANITPADNPFVADTSANARLVWEYGLRNPYSFQIDPPTGDLFIADPGNDTYEEVDHATEPGMNFGWPSYEGPLPTGMSCPLLDTLTAIPPMYAYDRTKFLQGAAVITSPRYRRPAAGAFRFPAEYEGEVFVTDVGEGFLRRLHFNGTSWAIATPVPGQPAPEDWAQNMDGVTDFFIHPDGSLWYLKYAERFANLSGQLRKITCDNSVGVLPHAADELWLAAPYPSPAWSQATLSFSLARAGRARLAVLDLAGREIARLVDDADLPASRHTRGWDLRDARGQRAAPGLYFAVLEAGGRRLSRALVVAR